ncbi:hypothetical protein FGG08_006515 [Glutinoglossum americanum]|uniref:DUF676 domain-containing protein n=1 Tax=Glutinoglossum americanum TaxID=1670608 RepID=A0A9P8L1U0_9PEZI|nr:hypothetical protein FGG08_006515 [Glutinoglossum americanum]
MMLRLLTRKKKRSTDENRETTGKAETDLQSNGGSSKAVSIKAGTAYGLENIYTPPNHSDTVVDIVFVHGLTGSSSDTWLDKKTGSYWPASLLSEDIDDARILSFGYDADVVNFWNPASQNRISDHAKNILGALARQREQTDSENRKIVFVVHSLGGLVTQNALCLSRTSPDKHIRRVGHCTMAIAFLGTPHFGADIASWAKFGTNITNIVKRANADIVSVLKPGSEMLANIQDGFHSILRLRINEGTEIAITCFFEELSVVVVGEDMTKFAGSNDSGYKAILGELRRWIRPLRLATHGSDVKVEPCQPMLNSETPSRKTCFMVKFNSDRNFIGREDIMKEIGERLKMGQRRVAITGIGGVGKSRIAIEYCYKYRNSHPKAQVFWVHSSNSARFEEAYKDIARELTLPGLDDPDTNTLQLVYKWLSDDASGPWLLVLDNADDMEAFFGSGPHTSSHQSEYQPTAALVNYLPRSSNGSIIITTRDRRVGERLSDREKSIPVLPFTSVDAEYLLQCKLPESDGLNKAASTGLVKALNYLALPITQAAAFISENGITIAEYLEMLQAGNLDTKDILEEDLPDPGRDVGVPNSVFRAWELSFDQIRKQKPRAAEILSLMAALDRQAISDALLRNDDERKVEFITAIGTLKAFSLITEEQGGKMFGMHRLLQFSTQIWLKRQHVLVEWQEKALDVVSKCCPSDGEYENWAAWRAINPHVQVVLGYTFQRTPCLLQRASILNNEGCYNRKQGQHKAACGKLAEALAIRETVLGPDHISTLDTVHNLGALYRGQAKFAEAEAMYDRALAGKEKALGPDHTSTLDTVHNLGALYSDQGKFAEAEAMYDRALAGSEKALGPDHTSTLDTGKFAEAEAMYDRALAGKEKALGPDHTSTLNTVHNLGSLYSDQGKLAKAEAMYDRALAGYEKALGPDHTSTLNTVHNLGSLYRDQDKLAKAEAMYQRHDSWARRRLHN